MDEDRIAALEASLARIEQMLERILYNQGGGVIHHRSGSYRKETNPVNGVTTKIMLHDPAG